jgi:predicted aspartyl protease
MRFNLLGIYLLLGALTYPSAASAQGAWPEGCKLVRMAELPITLQGGHAMIPVQVNGKEVLMVVDTGQPITSLSKAAITDLGLVTHLQNSRLMMDIGGRIADEYVRVSDFRLDHLERGGVYFGVMEYMPEAGGLLGPDVLRNYDVDLDFGQGRFSLYRHHPCADRAVYWTANYAVLPFSSIDRGRVVEGGANKEGVLNAGRIRVPVTLDGQETYAVIDTGAPTSVISIVEAEHLFGLTAASPDVKAAGHLSGGAGGEVIAYSYPFKTLVMGGVTVSNPQIRISESRNFLLGNYASMLLGMDVLQKLHLYIAYDEGKLYMTSADAR